MQNTHAHSRTLTHIHRTNIQIRWGGLGGVTRQCTHTTHTHEYTHNTHSHIHTHTQDKYSDQVGRLGRGDEAMYEELFAYAGPKFFYPGHPNYEDPSNPVNAKDISLTLNQQWTVFKVLRMCLCLCLLRTLSTPRISPPPLTSNGLSLRTLYECVSMSVSCLMLPTLSTPRMSPPP